MDAVIFTVAAVLLVGLWCWVFIGNRGHRERETSLDFPGRDETRMWAEIQAALTRPTEGDK